MPKLIGTYHSLVVLFVC